MDKKIYILIIIALSITSCKSQTGSSCFSINEIGESNYRKGECIDFENSNPFLTKEKGRYLLKKKNGGYFVFKDTLVKEEDSKMKMYEFKGRIKKDVNFIEEIGLNESKLLLINTETENKIELNEKICFSKDYIFFITYNYSIVDKLTDFKVYKFYNNDYHLFCEFNSIDNFNLILLSPKWYSKNEISFESDNQKYYSIKLD